MLLVFFDRGQENLKKNWLGPYDHRVHRTWTSPPYLPRFRMEFSHWNEGNESDNEIESPFTLVYDKHNHSLCASIGQPHREVGMDLIVLIKIIANGVLIFAIILMFIYVILIAQFMLR